MIGACWGLACSEALPSPYPGFPLERASRSQLAGVTPSPVPTRWDGKDYLLFSAARRRRRYQRISQSCCSGAAWWTPGGAYIEHARVAEVTGELLPAQPGLQPGLIVVVVVVEVVVAPPPDDERSPCHTLLAAATATATAATAAAAAARPPPPPPMHVACMSYE